MAWVLLGYLLGSASASVLSVPELDSEQVGNWLARRRSHLRRLLYEMAHLHGSRHLLQLLAKVFIAIDGGSCRPTYLTRVSLYTEPRPAEPPLNVVPYRFPAESITSPELMKTLRK